MAQTQSTAVNWLIEQILSDQLIKSISQNEWLEVFKQAKQMEKEQIMKAYNAYYDTHAQKFFEGKYLKGEQYYNETFNH